MTPSTQAAAPNRGRKLDEAANIIGVSKQTLRRQIDAGDIKAIRLSARCVLVTDEEINRVLSGQAA